MIYNFVETYQGIFEGGNRENREVWCCSKGRGGDDEIQPVKESIIETPELPAKITVTVDLTLVSQKDGGTINVVADQKKNPLPSEWNLKCGISGQNRYILSCEATRTEKFSKELPFAPIFPLGYIKEYVSLGGYSGISTERLTFVSEEIKNCGGKKIKWKTPKAYLEWNGCEIWKGKGDHNVENDYTCCPSGKLGVQCNKDYWCAGLKEHIEADIQYANCDSYTKTTKWRTTAQILQLATGGDPLKVDVWCCSRGGGGDVGTQSAKESIIETPKLPAETEPTPVCGDGKCEGDETCKTCEKDCGCKGDLVCDNGKCVKAGKLNKPCRKVGYECDEELVCEKEFCKDKRVDVGVVGGNDAVKRKIKRSGNTVTTKPFELKNTGNVPITITDVKLDVECVCKCPTWTLGLCLCGDKKPFSKTCSLPSNTKIEKDKSLTISSCPNFDIKSCDGWSCNGNLIWKWDSNSKNEPLDLSCN